MGFSVPRMLAAGVVLRGSLGWGGAQRDSSAVGLVPVVLEKQVCQRWPEPMFSI